jgi:hypothetical protein
MQMKIQSAQERKADARKKIMLGGLFVKAQLDHFHPHDPAPYTVCYLMQKGECKTILC